MNYLTHQFSSLPFPPPPCHFLYPKPRQRKMSAIETAEETKKGNNGCNNGSKPMHRKHQKEPSTEEKTCAILPSLNLAFDIGKCPQCALSHAHMDHILRDTMSDFIIDENNADVLRAKILIMESTYVENSMTVENARDYGHTHLSEIIGYADKFENKAILLIHFSVRYPLNVIQEALSAVPPHLGDRIFALTEGL